jgi:hypothetical protein
MMQNRRILFGLLVIIVAVVAYGTYRYMNRPQQVTLTKDFEDGMGIWTPDSDVPMDPNNPGERVAWNISITDEIVYQGSYAAHFYLDGRQDDGTIWLELEVTLKPNTKYDAELSFQLYSSSESFNKLAYVVGRVSQKDIEAEEDFADLGAANQLEGWKRYDHSTTLTTDETGVAYVGFGLSVVWETEIVYFIDQVEVKIAPR